MSTILVVDDEPDVRMLLRIVLGLDGHEIIEAGSGLEALDIVPRDQPDLIVLDVMMPELSGWDTLRRLKHHDDVDIREIPVLMLTALSEPLDRAKGGIEGAVRYLSKPIAPDDLRQAVLDALSGEPEPVQRRNARNRALEDIARIERGPWAPVAVEPAGPRMRFGGLETARPGPPAAAPPPPDLAAAAALLTAKQRQLLEAVRVAPTVLAAAAGLSMSRSNVYASLRRISRRLGVNSISELLERVHAGRLMP